MKFFNPLKSNPPNTEAITDLNPSLMYEKSDVLLRCLATLLRFLKLMALDIKELQPDRFKNDIDELRASFESSQRPKRIELDFEHKKPKILSFIDQQKSYLQDRDQELRDIITLLTKAMANFNVENIEFYQRVYDQSEKMIEITLLDDLKKIKTALQHEVECMRACVDQKKNHERRQMQFLAGQVDLLRQELETAKSKSMTDGLTGVYNRQAFDEYLTEKIEHCKIINSEFALVMLDLDDFKSINDTYGHLIGDRVLVAFAQKCRATIRGNDFFARYGGEEFAMVLDGANLRNAFKKARLICQTIAAVRYAADNRPSGDYLSMTVSAGVTAYKKKDTPETIIARADKALYEAKKGGKNRAVAKKS